jgi:hypothetical protein
MSIEAMATVRVGTKQERIARLKKLAGLSDKSLSILIQECELYDWDSTTRLTLLVLCLGTRNKAENTDGSKKWVQEDCPWDAEEMVGWCDFSQWRIALRVGKSEDRIQKVLSRLEKDGVITIERWTDSNNANHDRYQINEAVIRANQRPEQKRDVSRPSRYKVKRGANAGSFSSKNQPKKSGSYDADDE